MPLLTVDLNGDGILKDFPREKVIHLETPITVTALAGGMESGLPSVAFIFDLPDGRKVLAQTSGRLFVMAARAIQARYGNLEDVPDRPLIAEQDEEDIQRWIWGVENEAPQPSGDFLKKIVAAALHADPENYPLLRPAIIALKNRFPKYRLDDPHLEPALHRDRHQLLHRHLDELSGDYLGHNRGAMPSNTTLTQLMEWSYKQTIEPES